MPLLIQLGDPQSLAACLTSIKGAAPSWTWLFVARDTSNVTANLPCHPQVIGSAQMSEQEADAFEQAVGRAGLKPLLSLDQLEDVVSNLREQLPTVAEKDLIAAIDYYWKYDAFLTLGGDAT